MRVVPVAREVRVMFMLVDDVDGDVSQRRKNGGNWDKSKENLKKDFRDNQHFVISIEHEGILFDP